MFLKRLETVGFKSFAERIQLEFVPGVTAVVGPNGSGKSNIIDAIRWVLGEQSARSLRGKKMEDIIFQGSDTRGALNFAEVSLILDNDDGELPIDYKEVNITRRVYRSGESEFFINKQSCRLKDIVDLFMDTGLGRESFSIIGQGKIDEILSSKAEERRAIFEEAAGVLKYKQRKNQAQYKLGETENNLDRVEDIIHEIEQQITPLKEQARVARQYKEKKSELKKLEISLLVTEIKQLHTKWQLLLKEIEEKKLTAVKEKTIIQKKEAKLTEAQHFIQKMEEEINGLQNDLVSITELLEQYEGKRNVLKERFKHLQENEEKLLKEKETERNRISKTEQSIEREREKIKLVNQSIEQAQDEVKKLEAKLTKDLPKINEKIENLKSDYIEFLNEQAVLNNRRHNVQEQLDQLTNSKEDTSPQDKKLISQEAELKSTEQQLEEEITKLKADIKRTEKEIVLIKENILENKSKYETMKEQLYDGNEQIAKLTSRKEMLEEMKDSFQGYFFGVKEILQAKKEKQLKNIYGAVVDLIEVLPEYMTAIDTILGAQAQYIVVPDDTAARDAIAWLKQENKGRATFLPLKSIGARTIPPSLINQLKKEKGFIGIASNVVQIDKQFQKVTEHLMGNVILVHTIQHATAIARLTKRKYRLVTLEGDMVFPGGSMSGGAKRKANQSLFTREKEISILADKLERFSKRRDEFINQMDHQQKRIAKEESALEEKEKELEQLKEKLQFVAIKSNEIKMALQSVTTSIKAYRVSKQQARENLLELQTELKAIEAELKSVIDKIKRTENEMERLHDEEQAILKNEKNIETKIQGLKITIAEQEERRKNDSERIQMLTSQLDEYKDQYEEVETQLKELRTMEEAETEKVLVAKINEYSEKRNQILRKIEHNQQSRNRQMQLREDEEREIKQLNIIYEKLVAEIQEKEVALNRLDVTLDNNLNILQSEYTITYEKAAKEYEQVKEIQSAKEEVQALKQSIKRLGTVNLGSIEEYERLTERYEFLSNQKEDLIEAKNTLYAVIQEMDQEMTERFSIMFKEIQSAFKDVFKQLFDGGHAELTLTEPSNILETGIEISARPPGKKLRTLGLLSGGERALTAIALLFAILKARPVPFCILDEVDAALDEANVTRFGNYLKTFSNDTQFIVITHRKGTMEEADVLYGVTMQESGVSRLVSVKLTETADVVEVR